MNWLKRLEAGVRFNEPLSLHTTLGVGGPVTFWVEPSGPQQLRQAIDGCRKAQVRYIVIGKGSNLLVSDAGFSGMAICLSTPAFTKIKVEGKRIICGSGLSLPQLLTQTTIAGLGGLEFLAGIPATVGGALVMNAGGKKNNIGLLVESVEVMDGRGKIKVLRRRSLKFTYRYSNLNRYIVLEATLKLVKRDPRKIRENIKRFLAEKAKVQELGARSAGCIFKNLRHNLTAGEMIEACGLKGRRQAGAEISARHANYIVNRNGARARDIFYLMDLARTEVKKRFGVCLEPEIKIIK